MSSTRMTLGERYALGLIIGPIFAAAFAAFDLYAHAASFEPVDLLIAFGFAVLPAVLGAGLVTFTLTLTCRLTRWSPTRGQWAGLLAGCTVVAATAAIVAVGTYRLRNWLGVMLIVEAIPFGLLAYVLVSRLRGIEAPGGPIYWSLAALGALLLAVVGVGPRLSGGTSSLIALLAASLVLAASLWAWRTKRRTGLATGLASAASLVLIAGSLGIWQHPSRARATPADARATPPPNVVLIMLDTTRRDHVGGHGHTGSLTPELDRIASEGVVYQDAFSTAPWTIPSHASVFTGLYPATHGCSNEHHLWLDDEFVTLAEMLHDAGYQTVALNSNVALEPANVFQGFDTCLPLYGVHTVDRMTLAEAAKYCGFPARWVDQGCGEAVNALSRWLERRYDSARPVFLFVNLLEAHHPYLPPLPERADYLPEGVSLIEATRFGKGLYPILLHYNRSQDPHAIKLTRALYAASVRYQDRRMGELLSLLRRQLDFENTLLIITADHGENLGEAGRWDHQFAVNDHLIHVPLVIRYPKAFPAGTRVAGLCQNVDLVPTVFDVLHRPCPLPDLPGRTLVPDRFVPRETVFAQVDPYYMRINLIQQKIGFQADVHPFLSYLRTLHTGRLKYVWSSDGRHRLFDVTHDPDELVNLVARMPAEANDLHTRLLEVWQTLPRYAPAQGLGPATPLYEQQLEQLRSLGYVE